ncbi:hypothetical protein OS493_013831 [Desmophyllum pertusum]|uniref:VWFA domain-containing protein n=1 Tax=Desmophyllum pertusum TaxID=174260 RepID=A0A9X0D3D5_9CNID|nr:hypothetical protein OS493_013831 [Desmophyllum pertusum]
MVDASSSINGKDNFQLVMNFVTDVFHSFTLGSGIRYGLVVFGSSAKVVFGFDKYTSINDVEARGFQSYFRPVVAVNVGRGSFRMSRTSLFIGDAAGRTPEGVDVSGAGGFEKKVGQTHGCGLVESALTNAEKIGNGKATVRSGGGGMGKCRCDKKMSKEIRSRQDDLKGCLMMCWQMWTTKSLYICEVPQVGAVNAIGAGGVAVCDLAIMVDASSSINGKDNFQLVMNFVTDVFHSFTLGSGIRYGLVVFGSSAKVVFGFDKYTSINDVDAEVSSLTLTGGSCNVGAALLECQNSLFIGDAAGRTRILLVITAGKSTDDVINAAVSLTTAGVKTIAVGIGGLFDRSELSAMALTSSHVLTATSFSSLPVIDRRVPTLISQASGMIIRENAQLISGGCDLAFMVDASSNIKDKANFRLVLNFVTRVFHSFTLGDGVRYGLVVFGESVKVVFEFSRYTSMAQVDSAVANVELMDGEAAQEVSSSAGALKTAGIKIIAVGMGDSFDKSQLSAMAFSPSYVLTAASFNGLPGIGESVSTIVSQAGGIGTALVTRGAQVDLGFLIDGSENINKYGAGNFQKCLEFVKLITKPFVISPTDTRVGAIVFSHQTELQFNFNQYKTKPEVEAAIDRIQYPSSLTYDGKGLTMVAEKLFNDIRVGVSTCAGHSNRGMVW